MQRQREKGDLVIDRAHPTHLTSLAPPLTNDAPFLVLPFPSVPSGLCLGSGIPPEIGDGSRDHESSGEASPGT